MIRDLGIVNPGTLLYIPFHTFDSNDPSASVTITGLATTDIEIYKDGSVTQRASDSGYALLDTDGIDFDALTGIHGLSVDLADNTTAGFYAAGSQYWIVVSSITVDAATVSFVLATFRIGYEAAVLNTTIATLSSQTSFTLTDGPAEDDALNGMWVIIHDVASKVQKGYAVISDYTGSTKTVTLAAGTTFTAAASDNISVMGPAPLQPTVTGRTLDVASTGEAGVDFSNINGTLDAAEIGSGAITAAKFAAGAIDAAAIAADAIGASELAADAVAEIADAVWDELQSGHVAAGSFGEIATEIADILTDTGTTLQGELDGIQADTEDIQTRLPAALVSGRIDASVGAVAAGAITAAAIATGAVDADALAADAVAEIADGVWDEARSGHVTDGTFGQAAQVVRSGTAQAGGASTITLDASASATDDIYNGGVVFILSGTGASQARQITDYVGSTKVATVDTAWTTNPDNTSVFIVYPAPVGSSAAEIADAVWDEATSGHSTAGTTGKALTDAGSAGDPWTTALPGAYGAGTAGKIVGDNLNATVSSRASQTSLDTLDDYVDTEVAAIKAQTDKLTFDGSNRVAADAQAISADSAAADALETMLDGTGGNTLSLAQLNIVNTNGSAIIAQGGTNGSGIWATGSGTGNGITATGGNSSGGDGIECIAGALGVDFNGDISGSIASLGTQAKLDVNVEVLDVLNTDTFAEPTGAPAATASLVAKISYLYMALRNKLTITSASKTFCDDSGAAEWSKALTDDGTTYTEAEGA